MFATTLKLDRHAARFALAILGTLSLTGCQAVVSTAPEAQVRVIDASPDAPGLDIYEGPPPLSPTISALEQSPPTFRLTPGTYTFNADYSRNQAGSLLLQGDCRRLQVSTPILIGNVAASLASAHRSTTRASPRPPGQIALRFIDQATRIGAVDIYLVPAGQKLTAVSPLVSDITFGVNTGYLNIPTGTYTIIMVPAGTVPISTTVATYTGPQVTYTRRFSHHHRPHRSAARFNSWPSGHHRRRLHPSRTATS